MKAKARYVWFGMALALAGCTSDGHIEFLGYTTRPPFDPEIQRIYIHPVDNYTYHRGLEFQVRRALIEEIGRRSSPLRITSDRDRADAELYLSIVRRQKQVINFNQQNETRDAELSLQVDVAFLDLRPGRCGLSLLAPGPGTPGQEREEFPPPPTPILDPRKAPRVSILPTANYIPELGGSQASAEARLAQNLAKQIVNMMESYR
jgi:hypothetical protein